MAITIARGSRGVIFLYSLFIFGPGLPCLWSCGRAFLKMQHHKEHEGEFVSGKAAAGCSDVRVQFQQSAGWYKHLHFCINCHVYIATWQQAKHERNIGRWSSDVLAWVKHVQAAVTA